jgi:hypothetical protein
MSKPVLIEPATSNEDWSRRSAHLEPRCASSTLTCEIAGEALETCLGHAPYDGLQLPFTLRIVMVARSGNCKRSCDLTPSSLRSMTKEARDFERDICYQLAS